MVDAMLQKAGDASQNITGVAIATMASTVLGVGRDGLPLTPIYTYADTRPWGQAEGLRNELDAAAIYQRTGCPLHTAYLPARLRWLQQTCPETVQRVARWIDIGTFLYSRWFGRADIPTSYSIASWTGLLDRHRLQWDHDILEHLGIPTEHLPPVADYMAAAQGLALPFSSRWPTLGTVPSFWQWVTGQQPILGVDVPSPTG